MVDALIIAFVFIATLSLNIFADTLLIFLFAGKMQNMRSLLLKANQRVSGQSSGSRKKDSWREASAEAWFPVRVLNDHVEEDEVPLKRKKMVQSSKGNDLGSTTRPCNFYLLFQTMFYCAVCVPMTMCALRD